MDDDDDDDHRGNVQLLVNISRSLRIKNGNKTSNSETFCASFDVWRRTNSSCGAWSLEVVGLMHSRVLKTHKTCSRTHHKRFKPNHQGVSNRRPFSPNAPESQAKAIVSI